jgi:replicative DNA helicase
METTLYAVKRNEQVLLGIIIQSTEISKAVFAYLSPADFYYTIHQKIADIVKTLSAIQEVDMWQVCIEAKKRNCLAEIGGEAYLAKLISDSTIATHWRHYARLVKQASLERVKVKLSNNIKELENSEETIKKLVAVQRKIDSLDEVQFDLRDYANALRKNIFEEKSLIRTGFRGVDDSAMTGGDLVVVAARPGVGKSIFAANILNSFLDQGYKCLVYTTEMTPEQYMLRQVCIFRKLWYFGFRNGYATDDDKVRLDEATTGFTEKYKNLLIYSKTQRPSSADVKREIDEYKPDIIILDNLSSVKLTSKAQNKTEKIGEFLEEIKETIVDKKLLCILVCHINRTAEQENSNEPVLSNLKDSSKIEELANKVIIMWPAESTQTDMVINWKYSKDRDGLGGFGRFFINKNFLTMRGSDEKTG